MRWKYQDRLAEEALSGPVWEIDWRGIATVGFLSIVAWLAVIGFLTVLGWLI